jgi:hypothetical protein
VLAGGRLAEAFRLAWRGDREGARQALEAAAAAGASTFTVQADGTVVLAGVPDPRVSALLAELADVESTGHATVYRLSEASLRRALDRGSTEDAISAFLNEHAAHGVPQTVSVLLADAARRAQTLVVGHARAFVQVADPALAEQLLRTRKLAKLGLRRAGEATLVADVEPKALAAGLKAAGFLPAETASPPPRVRGRAGTRSGRPVQYHAFNHRPAEPSDSAAIAERLYATGRS